MSLSTGTLSAKQDKELDRYNQIEALYDAKDKLLLDDNVDTTKIKEIDSKLQNLGVETLTQSEVEKRFPSSKSKTPLTTDVTPYVTTPSAPNVVWTSYRNLYTYNGKTYEVQRLIAEANTQDSKLKGTGSKAISTNYKWAAGAMNLIKTVSGLNEVAGPILTFYDAVVGSLSAISRETEIDGADCVYSYSYVTRVIFSYVKESGKSDSTQSLSYISSKCTVAVGYQIPSFTYKTSNGSTIVTPTIVTGSRNYIVTPSGYDSVENAVYAYLDNYAQSRAFVYNFDLIGLDGQTVSSVYPVRFEFPAQVF